MLDRETVSEIGNMAAELFLDPLEHVYAVPQDYRNIYPIRYVPFGIGEAINEIMADLGYTIKQLSDPSLREPVEECVKSEVANWRDIYISRYIVAKALNNYSPHGSFNPN